MRFFTADQWDQRCKSIQKKELAKWQKSQESARELLSQAREEYSRLMASEEPWTADTWEELRGILGDLTLSRRELAKPRPVVRRSSFTGQTESLSHPEAMAELRVQGMFLRPQWNPEDSGRLRTYKRVKNGMKRARRLIRASGGQAG